MRLSRTFGLLGIVATGILMPAVGTEAGTPPGTDTGAVTPVQHLVVLYQENVSFDHYFATYPLAANPAGQPAFQAAADTPTINGLNAPLNAPNNTNAAQPFRLDRSQYETCDQNHTYSAEQKAFDSGLMDRFVEATGVGNTTARPCTDYGLGKALVMGYYDGNTVTALWNYAQKFAMSDNSYGSQFGPSTPGALNLVAGQTHGAVPPVDGAGPFAGAANGTVMGDPQPTGDQCDTRDNVSMAGQNIGNLLNNKGVTWGWFQGGFRATSGLDKNGNPTTNTCLIGHKNMAGVFNPDYIPHHEPFQYFASTQNLNHLPPSSTSTIGKTDQANHQYDLTDFWAAVDAHNMPAVSFLKAPAYQDGHASYSDPLDEQQYLVSTINRLEQTPYWNSTAVVIAYDDSDGWYDHVMSPIINQSQDPNQDGLLGTTCGSKLDKVYGGYQDRCGYGPRIPLLVISPFAKSNFVDHTTTDQSSILRLIEDNWMTGRIGNFSFDTKAGSLLNMFTFPPNGPVGGPNKLFLDPTTGEKGS